MGGAGGGLEEFHPIFQQVNPQWSNPNNLSAKPFIFHVKTSKLENGKSCICICLTDFNSNTFQAIKTVLALEDMREIAGIGGPWTDFVDYMKDSFTSDDLKIVLEGQSTHGGAVSARVIAQKSEGMPTISTALTKLMDDAAREAIANITLELFKLYKTQHELLINEQEHCCQLTNILTAERVSPDSRNTSSFPEISSIAIFAYRQERRDVIQGQLDASLASPARISVSRQEKSHIVQRERGASQASASVSLQDKDASPASSRALITVSLQEKDHTVREQDASTVALLRSPISNQEKNDAMLRELDASASRPQRYRKISTLSASDASVLKSPDKQRAKVTPSSKVNNLVVPAYRRINVKGTVLVDSDDE